MKQSTLAQGKSYTDGQQRRKTVEEILVRLLRLSIHSDYVKSEIMNRAAKREFQGLGQRYGLRYLEIVIAASSRCFHNERV